jgi:hypothetical protein
MELPDNLPNNLSENAQSALTSIRTTYTLSTTPKDNTEVDQVTVSNFLRTLAEVALSISSRRMKNRNGQ